MMLKKGLLGFNLTLLGWLFGASAFADHYAVTSMRLTNAEQQVSGCSQALHPEDANRAVGFYVDAGNKPFFWTQTPNREFVTVTLPLLAEENDLGQAFDINAGDVIVGYSQYGTATITRPRLDDGLLRDAAESRLPFSAVSWQNPLQPEEEGGPQVLALDSLFPSDLLESRALGINNNNLAIGVAETNFTENFEVFQETGDTIEVTTISRPLTHAVSWNALTGEVTDLHRDDFGSTEESSAQGVNNNGVIVGWYTRGTLVVDRQGAVANQPIFRAVQWNADGTTVVELHDLIDVPASLSFATAINDQGQVVGGYQDDAGINHAAFWDGDQFLTIGPIEGADDTEAQAINNNGVVVGIARTNGVEKGFYWDSGQGLDINTNPPVLLNELLGDQNLVLDQNGAPRVDDDGNFLLQWDVFRTMDVQDNGVITGCARRTAGGTAAVTISNAATDLIIRANGTPNPVAVDNVLRYNIPMANLGPHDAQNVIATITLPGGADYEFKQIVEGSGRCVDPDANNTILCEMNQLEVGESALVLVAVRPQDAGSITLTAEVSGSEDELNTANNSVSVKTKVDACFIATAAYGSYLDPHVADLRHFRDRLLRPLPGGQQLIDVYYRYSPALAAYIETRPWAKKLTRWLLTPVVVSIRHPWLPLMVIAMAILLIYRNRLTRTAPGH